MALRRTIPRSAMAELAIARPRPDGIYLPGMASVPTTHVPTTHDEVRQLVEEQGIEFLFAQFVDMHGKPNAKLVPAHHLDDLLTDGAGFAGFAAGDIGQRPHDPDMIAMPDVRSYTPLPGRPGVARFACDVTVEGQEWPYDPRTILRRSLARASEKGFEFKMGLELEYFLVTQREDGSIEI